MGDPPLEGMVTMAVQSLADMTWEEVRDLRRDGAVAILPVGAIEATGRC